jgi:hypothetical protein
VDGWEKIVGRRRVGEGGMNWIPGVLKGLIRIPEFGKRSKDESQDTSASFVEDWSFLHAAFLG